MNQLEYNLLAASFSPSFNLCDESQRLNEIPAGTTLGQKILCSKYIEVLEELKDIIIEPDCITSWAESVKLNVNSYIDTSTDTKLGHESILCCGIAALNLFAQQNFTGPIVDLSNSLRLRNSENAVHFKELIQSELGTDLYTMVRSPELLVLSKILFETIKDSELHSIKWWYFRLLKIYQSVVTEKKSLFYNQMISLIDDSLRFFETSNIDEVVLLLLKTEAAVVSSQYGDITRCKVFCKEIQKLAGLEVEMSGQLGTRTKFQTTPYAQLVLTVGKDRGSRDSPPFVPATLPRDVKLEDETLLPKISFLTGNDNQNLLPEEQLVILALLLLKQRSSAHDELLNEELIAFTESILQQPKVWSVQYCALFFRSQLEKSSHKRVERAMMQVQSLVDEFSNDRQFSQNQYFYCCPVPAFWVVEKELAQLLVSLGAIKSALDIFLRLHLWEDVVFCYKHLQRNNKAIEVINEQLLVNETPALLCLLGDVTNDPAHYEKAWTLSNGRSALAQKSLGYLHFQKKDYTQSIIHFLKSVEISTLDQKVWFAMGHAATQTSDFELAARCYRSVINFDSDNFEAWNNLSNAYLKLGQKHRAWKGFTEALRCDYENWKIWENFLLVSVDIGAFEDAIRACHRLMELKGEHVDNEVIEILTRGVTSDMLDANQQPMSLLTDKMLQLLGRITSKTTNNAKVWYCYGKVLASKEPTVESLDRVMQYYQKAYRFASQQPGWEKSAVSCREVLSYAKSLVSTYRESSSGFGNDDRLSTVEQSCRLMLKSVIKLVKKGLDDDVFVGEDYESIVREFEYLDSALKEL